MNSSELNVLDLSLGDARQRRAKTRNPSNVGAIYGSKERGDFYVVWFEVKGTDRQTLRVDCGSLNAALEAARILGLTDLKINGKVV